MWYLIFCAIIFFVVLINIIDVANQIKQMGYKYIGNKSHFGTFVAFLNLAIVSLIPVFNVIILWAITTQKELMIQKVTSDTNKFEKPKSILSEKQIENIANVFVDNMKRGGINYFKGE